MICSSFLYTVIYWTGANSWLVLVLTRTGGMPCTTTIVLGVLVTLS